MGPKPTDAKVEILENDLAEKSEVSAELWQQRDTTAHALGELNRKVSLLVKHLGKTKVNPGPAGDWATSEPSQGHSSPRLGRHLWETLMMTKRGFTSSVTEKFSPRHKCRRELHILFTPLIIRFSDRTRRTGGSSVRRTTRRRVSLQSGDLPQYLTRRNI